MEGKVIVLLRTSSVARVPMYHHLRHNLGLVLVVVHPWQPAAGFRDVFHHWLQHDTVDVDTLRPALKAFLQERGLSPDAIVSFDEYAVYQAAVLAAEYGLTCVPLPPREIQRTSVKADFRSFCAEVGIASPGKALLPRLPDTSSETTAASMAAVMHHIESCLSSAGLCFPLVLKPSPGAGSLLARRCDDLAEAAAHALSMWRAFDRSPDMMKHFVAVTVPSSEQNETASLGHVGGGGGASKDACTTGTVEVLMEEFIAGDEVDVDCVVQDGVVKFFAISDNFEPLPPYFAEAGGLCPSDLDMKAQRAIRDLLLQYVALYGGEAKTEDPAAVVERDRIRTGAVLHPERSSGGTGATGFHHQQALTQVSGNAHRSRSGVLNGVLHFEAKYDPTRGRAYVIEVNCRPGSAETNTMIRTAYRGFQLGEALVRCALGESVEAQLARHYPECFPDRSVPTASVCLCRGGGRQGAPCSSDAVDTLVEGLRIRGEGEESFAESNSSEGDVGSLPGGCSPFPDQATEHSREATFADVCEGTPASANKNDGSTSVDEVEDAVGEPSAIAAVLPTTSCGNGCQCSASCECGCCQGRCGAVNEPEDGALCTQKDQVRSHTAAFACCACSCASVKAASQPPAASTRRDDDRAGTDSGVQALWAYSMALGGPSVGAFPPVAYAASVNLYPSSEGRLTTVSTPVPDPSVRPGQSTPCSHASPSPREGSSSPVEMDPVIYHTALEHPEGTSHVWPHLVEFSVAAKPGDAVGPPPRPFCLLAWMVAHGGTSATAARARINALSARFHHTVEPSDNQL